MGSPKLKPQKPTKKYISLVTKPSSTCLWSVSQPKAQPASSQKWSTLSLLKYSFYLKPWNPVSLIPRWLTQPHNSHSYKEIPQRPVIRKRVFNTDNEILINNRGKKYIAFFRSAKHRLNSESKRVNYSTSQSSKKNED